MRPFIALILTLAACAPVSPSGVPPAPMDAEHPRIEWGLVLHGGAGVTRTSYSAAELPLMEATFHAALRAGHDVLARGGSSLDAVEVAVRILEDDSLFNAGKGAVFTNDSINELDAAIMDGPTYRAGAVAGLHRVRNPITLARAVMEKSKHVMMIGDGAERFAREVGVDLVDPGYFRTERRMRSLRNAIDAERRAQNPGGTALVPDPSLRFGTVGAVALDKHGRLAAATSTGGMTNKRYGRVGDVPIIGAGTYASPTCAVSATGDGEYFIRWSIAHSICTRTEFNRQSLASAADSVIMGVLERSGGEGGVISLDNRGNVAMPFNSAGMTRGYVGPDGRTWMRMFRD